MLPHGRLPLPTLSSGPSSGSLSAPGREDSATQSEWRRLRHRETSNWVGERRPAAAFSGVDIGDWKARRCLGKNAFGEVHEAENVLTRRRAALRLLHPYWSVDVAIKRRFVAEAEAAAEAGGAHVVQVLEGGLMPPQLCYLVMELVEAPTLASRLAAGGPFSVDRALRIGLELATTLARVHEAGVVHGDLRPESIFLVELGDDAPEPPPPLAPRALDAPRAHEAPRALEGQRVCISDFGISTVREALGGVRLTSTGAWCGVPTHLASDYWMELPDIDGRADIYSLGIILFQCMTGSLPFSGGSLLGWMEAHLQTQIPSVTELEWNHPLVASLLRRMLAKRREDRPRTMGEVSLELQSIIDWA